MAPQRAARIDPNPHQVEAVIFALRRVREGGCILADEVGLGKTIEAGLVIAQLLAEGARRVLLIAPKSLLGQWRQELSQLFDLDTREGSAAPGAFDGDGVFLVNREAAGSAKGRDALLAAAPFDLCVIDEAHEVFAGLYKRFTPDGLYDETSSEARTAGRVREVLLAGRTPVLLLTATPIQNNLAELWGLIQFVDPLGTLVGDLPTFREVFCGSDDRVVAPGQAFELRARLKHVLQRTLRRQAQAFLEKPFVDRQARLFEYTMSAAEKALYDDVTRYLLEPGILAFQGNQRQLLLLGFHRRMASSTPALAASLERVAARLTRMLAGVPDAQGDAAELLQDLDDGEPPTELEPAPATPTWASPAALALELTRVEAFVQRSKALGDDDGKFRALVQALRFVTTRAEQGHGSGKLVIFTESLVTQEHLRARLVEGGFLRDDDVTLFRGTNDSPRAQQALERWRAAFSTEAHPAPDIAMRLALVHEFQTRSRVFISTEAGAKGLNLQFCDTLVNYDLPWNPQRIEQRIGRCHRYGQQHDVTVINFLAKDNEAQALTFDILSRKLELFGTVLSASDQVLHRAGGAGSDVLVSALGAEFEGELKRIWERARTLDEVTHELRALRDKVAEERKRFEETKERTASLIEAQLDDDVQRVFRGLRESMPGALAEFDAELFEVVTAFLDRHAVRWKQTRVDGEVLLTVEASAVTPSTTVALGPSKTHLSLHLAHPLVEAAVRDARAVTPPACVGVKTPALSALQGRAGRLQVLKVTVDGFERVEQLLEVAVLDDGAAVPDASALLSGLVHDAPPRTTKVSDELMLDAREEALFRWQAQVDERELERAERARWQAERFVEDRLLVLRKRRARVLEQLDAALHRRDAAAGSVQRTEAEQRARHAEDALTQLERDIAKLEARDDETFRRHQAWIHLRRDTPPRVEVLFDVEFIIE